jgi:hypothetical protein
LLVSFSPLSTSQSTSNEAAVIQTIKSLFGGDVAIASAQRSYSHLLEKKMQVIADAKDRSLDSRAWIDMKANSVVIEIAEESRRADGYAGFINRFNNAPITINLDRKAGQPVRLSFHLVPKLQ